MTNQYALVDLEEERLNGHKWILGPFRSEDSGMHSETLEIGYVNLQEVEKTDQFHLHSNCEEYYLLLNGQMQIKVGESSIKVMEGQLLLVPRQVPHLILKVQPGTRILLIKAPPSPNDKEIISLAGI